MNICAIAGLTLSAAVTAVSLKKHLPEYSVIINIISGIILSIAVLTEISPVLNKINSIMSFAKIPEEYAMILFKSVGICFAVQFAADSCRDAGENSLASKVEFSGKIGILITALPLFETIIQTSLNFIGIR